MTKCLSFVARSHDYHDIFQIDSRKPYHYIGVCSVLRLGDLIGK